MNVILSVVLPFKEVDSYLKSAIDSTLADLPSNSELLVVSTSQNLSSFKRAYPEFSQNENLIEVLSSKPDLISKLNTGIGAARGKYIARMDADDIVLSGRFRAQLEFLENSKDTVVVGSSMIYICRHGTVIGCQPYPARVRQFPLKSLVPEVAHPTVMMRADVVRKLGGYSTNFPHVEDHDLWIRMQNVGAVRNLRTPFLKYRLHETQESRIFSGEQKVNGLLALFLDLKTTSKDSVTSEKVLSLRGREFPFVVASLESIVGALGAIKKVAVRLLIARLIYVEKHGEGVLEAGARDSLRFKFPNTLSTSLRGYSPKQRVIIILVAIQSAIKWQMNQIRWKRVANSLNFEVCRKCE
jgi:glycosyltransferase involved in cell wall biosynthesis